MPEALRVSFRSVGVLGFQSIGKDGADAHESSDIFCGSGLWRFLALLFCLLEALPFWLCRMVLLPVPQLPDQPIPRLPTFRGLPEPPITHPFNIASYGDIERKLEKGDLSGSWLFYD